MEARTYYTVLGVASTDSGRAIRAASRDLVKQLHSDVPAPEAVRALRELGQAYGVLSGPQTRRRYDDELRRAADCDALEPLVPEPLSVFANRDGIRPSFAAMYDRLLRNYTGIGVPKAERLEGLNLPVLLTPAQVANGCSVSVTVPTFSRCPNCRGTGRDWISSCLDCNGRGTLEHEADVWIQVPACSPGTVLGIRLDQLGIHNFYLRLHVFHTDQA